MAAVIGEVLAEKVEARAIPLFAMYETARAAGASDNRIEQMTNMSSHYDARGFHSNAEVLRFIIERPATSYRSYV